jgi:endoglucanase
VPTLRSMGLRLNAAVVVALGGLVGALLVPPAVAAPVVTAVPSPTGEFNYAEALQDSMLFYESQRSGPLPADNRVLWRGPSDLTDGADHGLDLTGGYHDAGDEVKFGFPQAYSMTALAWGGIADKAGYQASGQWQYLERNLRWGDDYIIKAHPSPHVFYGQVGDGSSDHSFWGPAEVNPSPRASYAVTESCPGSDLTGEAAAALASSSIVFRTDDPAYSATLISQAKSLYEFADNFRGRYDACITAASGFYTSFSGYWDELVWGALWLYEATGDTTYLTKAETYYANLPVAQQTTTHEFNWTINWDDKSYGDYVLLAEITGQQQYVQDAERNLDWFTSNVNGAHVNYSPGGEAQVDVWGTARYAANAAFLALEFGHWLGSKSLDPTRQQAYHDFAVRQVNYTLGDNPNHESYVVGFTNGGSNTAWPKFIHNRPAHDSWDQSMSDPPNTRHLDYGLLVGGPTSGDGFADDRTNFQQTEGALDYNALYSGDLAELVTEYGGTPRANFPPTESPDGPEQFMQAAPNATGTNFIEIKAQVVNKSGWPARHLTKGSFRYYFTLDPGETPSQVQLTSPFNQCTTPTRITQFAGSVYYVTVDCTGQDIAPAGQSQFHREVQFRLTFPAAHDYTKDWSYQGLTGLANGATPVNTTFIELYDGTTKVWGTGPSAQAGTPPAAPANVTATGVGPTSATLSWTAATAGTNPVTGYDVFTTAGVRVGTSTSTSFPLTGLTAGTTYGYYVVATDSAGSASAPSAGVTFTTSSGQSATPPGAPGTPTASNVTASGVTLTWAAATAGSNPVAGYDVFSESGTTATKVASTTGTSAVVTGLAASATYVFDVVARDAAGTVSAASAKVTVTTAAGPSGGSVKAQYKNNDTNVTDSQARPGLTLVNTGSTAIPLADVTVRYWFSSDGGAGTFTAYCDYAAIDCAKVTQTVNTVTGPVAGADHYLEVGFTSTAGSLAAGASLGDLQERFNKTDWSTLNQVDDYSFGTGTSYADAPRVTVYVAGRLVWGTEPR